MDVKSDIYTKSQGKKSTVAPSKWTRRKICNNQIGEWWKNGINYINIIQSVIIINLN